MTDDADDCKDDSFVSPRERAALVKASIAHLLDLKRQDYSPRFCELVVDRKTDRILQLPERRPRRGPRPSPAPIVQPLLLRRKMQ